MTEASKVSETGEERKSPEYQWRTLCYDGRPFIARRYKQKIDSSAYLWATERYAKCEPNPDAQERDPKLDVVSTSELSPDELKRMEAIRPKRRTLPVVSTVAREGQPTVSFDYLYADGIAQYLSAVIKNPNTEAVVKMSSKRDPRTIYFNCTGLIVSEFGEKMILTPEAKTGEDEKRAKCLSDLDRVMKISVCADQTKLCVMYDNILWEQAILLVVGKGFDEYISCPDEPGMAYITRLLWE
jgi:hypothetical protein